MHVDKDISQLHVLPYYGSVVEIALTVYFIFIVVI